QHDRQQPARRLDQRACIAAAGFEQQHAHRRIFAEARSQYATSRTTADDDVIERFSAQCGNLRKIIIRHAHVNGHGVRFSARSNFSYASRNWSSSPASSCNAHARILSSSCSTRLAPTIGIVGNGCDVKYASTTSLMLTLRRAAICLMTSSLCRFLSL